MCQWLLFTIDSWEGQRISHKFNLLQNVMILLVVISNLDLFQELHLEGKHYKVLFKGLCTISEFKNAEVWPHFAFVQEAFLTNYTVKSKFVDILKKLQKKAKSLNVPIPEILFSFPVLNFIQGSWTPFKVMNELPNMNATRRATLRYFKEVTANWYTFS